MKVTASGNRPLVEVAVDSVEAALVAAGAGADRLELCQALEIGGLSPSEGLIREVLRAVAVPVFAMIRPRPGGFTLQPGDLAVMVTDIEKAREAGCAGVVIGALTAERTVDAPAVERMIAAARDRPVTFHRAFDSLAAPLAAMPLLARLGVTRVLTSGGGATAFEGRVAIAALVGAKHPAVIAGGGVDAATVAQLVRTTAAREIHLAGVRFEPGGAGFGRESVPNPTRLTAVLAALAT